MMSRNKEHDGTKYILVLSLCQKTRINIGPSRMGATCQDGVVIMATIK